MNYYNEHDPKAAAWLRELIAGGYIPAGVVDERSITEISPDELSEYTQCHFFAGIGGWPLALELAGWPTSRPVWTGSCPCQPFSSAGKGKGASDDRHLWPVFRRLIAKLRPERVFGEQVAQAIGFNWLDGVSADLEADGYAVGAAVLGAHSVGAPHIRQRLYWVADARCNGSTARLSKSAQRQEGITEEFNDGGYRIAGGLADAAGGQREQRIRPQGDELQRFANVGATGKLADVCSEGLEGDKLSRERIASQRQAIERGGDVRQLGVANCTGRDQRRITSKGARHRNSSEPTGFWDHYEVVHCRDGKARRFESGSFPLANGIPGRVGLLRGYGNAIVPQAAALFIRASE